jgi:hypothetical protein
MKVYRRREIEGEKNRKRTNWILVMALGGTYSNKIR